MLTLSLILTALFILWILLEIRNAPVIENDFEETPLETIAWNKIEEELEEWILDQDRAPTPNQIIKWFKKHYHVPGKK